MSDTHKDSALIAIYVWEVTEWPESFSMQVEKNEGSLVEGVAYQINW